MKQKSKSIECLLLEGLGELYGGGGGGECKLNEMSKKFVSLSHSLALIPYCVCQSVCV